MTPEQFCYWLQGRAELQPDTPPSAEEWKSIREHLGTVFLKVTPQIGLPPNRFATPHFATPNYSPPSFITTTC